MISAIEAEKLARAHRARTEHDPNFRFNPIRAVVGLKMRVVLGDRATMRCDAQLRPTLETESGYEIELARGLTYVEQVWGVAHESGEYEIKLANIRPYYSEDPAEAAHYLSLMERAADTVALAIACPEEITQRLYDEHGWDLSAYRKELHVSESRIAVRLGNLLMAPVAVVRKDQVHRSDYWRGPLYDEQIIHAALTYKHELCFDLEDEQGIVVRWP